MKCRNFLVNDDDNDIETLSNIYNGFPNSNL